MKIGICAHPSDVTEITEPPFDYLEGNVQGFLVPEKSDEEFSPFAQASGGALRPLIAANCFLPADLKVSGPSVDCERLGRYADNAFRRAASIGMATIVFGSGGARQLPGGWSASEGFEQYVAALRLCGPLAEKHGVTLVVEPLNRGECNLVNTVDEGAEAVRRCGHPNIRLLVDIFHMLRNGEAPESISRHADVITHAHVAENEDRAQPGVHGEDFRPFLRALRKAESCRHLTIECNWTAGMREGVRAAVQALRRQLDDV